MRLGLIHLANLAWLVIVLVGVPAITGIQFGKIRLSSTPEFQLLTLAGLALGAAANLIACFVLKKQRRAFYLWMSFHGILFGAHYLYFNGYIHFQWLKDALLRLKR